MSPRAVLLVAFAAVAAAAPARAVPTPPCDVWVYVVDPDPKGVNLRDGPAIRGRVVAVIPRDPDGTLVHVTFSANGWMRVVKAETVEGKAVFAGTAWGHGSRFAVATRGSRPLFHAPRPGAGVVGRTPMDHEMTLTACTGKWLQVRSAQGAGWLAPDGHCGSPVTTCP